MPRGIIAPPSPSLGRLPGKLKFFGRYTRRKKEEYGNRSIPIFSLKSIADTRGSGTVCVWVWLKKRVFLCLCVVFWWIGGFFTVCLVVLFDVFFC